MPMYEYYCQECSTRFEQLRPLSAADTVAVCPTCQHPRAQRVISLVAAFARPGETRAFTMGATPTSQGGHCCSGGGCSCSH
jgi:putative FmdB family regulatory protein